MPTSTSPPRVRVVVQLPYNRPDDPYPNPPHIEWNAEKANILWEVIALSRTSDNGGTDWKGLAAHLEVPLPYLLYRAQARYEEDLRGLQDIRGVLATPASVTTPFPAGPSTTPSTDTTPTIAPPAHPLSIKIPVTGKLASVSALGARRLSASQRLMTPLGVRARLNSLTHKSPSKQRHGAPLRAPSPFSNEDESEESDEEELAQRKEEEAQRQAEEQEHLDKKLAQLQRMMTGERVGLVRSPMSPEKGKEREDVRKEEIIRGRPQFPASGSAASFTPNGNGGALPAPGSPTKARFNDNTRIDGQFAEFSSPARGRDHSASVSSASSPQGSIPSIPSPSMSSPSPPPAHRNVPTQQTIQVPTILHPSSHPQSLASSPMQRHLSPSVRNARSHAHTRQNFGALGAAAGVVSEGESTHGSSTSSFSDLSDASLSASALESALMSNIRGTGSRFSAITRSRLGGRGVRQ